MESAQISLWPVNQTLFANASIFTPPRNSFCSEKILKSFHPRHGKCLTTIQFHRKAAFHLQKKVCDEIMTNERRRVFATYVFFSGKICLGNSVNVNHLAFSLSGSFNRFINFLRFIATTTFTYIMPDRHKTVINWPRSDTAQASYSQKLALKHVPSSQTA